MNEFQEDANIRAVLDYFMGLTQRKRTNEGTTALYRSLLKNSYIYTPSLYIFSTPLHVCK